MQQLLAHAFREVTDAALGDAILEMGVDAKKGELLAHIVTCLLEGIVRELPAVVMVMYNFNTALSSKSLEGAIGGDGLDRGIIDLEVHKMQAAEMIQ